MKTKAASSVHCAIVALVGILSSSCAVEALESCEGAACDELAEKGLQVIYGSDDRIEYAAATTRQKGWADPVAGLVARPKLTCPAGGANCSMALDSSVGASGVEITTGTTTAMYPVCSGERYASQFAAPYCSSFLVGPDLMATAGHCFDADDSMTTDLVEAQAVCAQLDVVFGFTDSTINQATGTATVAANNRYSCKTVTEVKYDRTLSGIIKTDGRDWAIFQLDRAVTGRAPHAFRRTGRVSNREALTIAGHPFGLPLKLGTAGTVRAATNAPQTSYIWKSAILLHSADSQQANSGSPIINSGTGMVEGVHVASPGSFQVDTSSSPHCARWKVCTETGCPSTDLLQWGEAMRSDRLRGLVPSIAPKTFEERGAAVSVSYQPFTGDFDGDGEADVYWFGPLAAPDAVSWGNSSRTFTAGTDSTAQDYKPFAGDFDRDGSTDIFWYGPGTIQDRVSWGNAARTFGSSTVTNTSNVALPNTAAAVYTPLVGDFDGDGYSDILWYAPGAGVDLQWYGTSSRKFVQQGTAFPGTYEKTFVGDFNGDGRSDVFWYNRTAASQVSYGTAARGFTTVVAKDSSGNSLPTTAFTGIYVGDFDGDKRSDLYFYGSGAIVDLQWFGTTTNSFNAMADQATGIYKPIVGDFNGDALDDIFWYSETTTDRISWGAVGRNFPTTNVAFSLGAGYRLYRDDFDGNSTSDIYAYVSSATAERIFYGTMKP